ncbi:hypothetical protein B2G71_12775 [Novosphingobium sp. PC22D]|uniref:gamma-glutamylcyclotransferase family protein n=1 Tax=Novosphingobium sp. PC22D TaxID=1962403 RepID=UPI000BFAF0C0|nr:gamma-glutamylcyclotransferase family protein [Novosphingobium sp. PC22D]PEQ12362.1 hypothetical protein B2G71_12775 [Novosphingobium sp. PC22D]
MRRIDLFLYGTLQPAAGTRMARWLETMARDLRPARVPGRIVALRGGNGWFPALQPGSSGMVCGTLAELDLPPGALAKLDRYEGGEYRRRALRVRRGDGAACTAQVYVWTAPLPEGALPVAGGDFLRWLERSGRRAFTTPRNGA